MLLAVFLSHCDSKVALLQRHYQPLRLDRSHLVMNGNVWDWLSAAARLRVICMPDNGCGVTGRCRTG